MTSIISARHNAITRMVIRATVALCMVAMIVGCSSGRDGSSRLVTPAGGGAGQVQAPNGALANKAEDLKDGCLTKEQKQLKMKELNEKDSWLKNFGEHTVVRGGGNLLGSIFGFGNAGEYADMANGARKMTVQGNTGRDFIDTVVAKDCGSEHKAPAAPSNAVDGASVVR